MNVVNRRAGSRMLLADANHRRRAFCLRRSIRSRGLTDTRVVGSGTWHPSCATDRAGSSAPRHQHSDRHHFGPPECVSAHHQARRGHGDSRSEGVGAVRVFAAPLLRALREPGRARIDTHACRAPDVCVLLRLRVRPVLGKSHWSVPGMPRHGRQAGSRTNGRAAPADGERAVPGPTQVDGGGCRGSRRPGRDVGLGDFPARDWRR